LKAVVQDLNKRKEIPAALLHDLRDRLELHPWSGKRKISSTLELPTGLEVQIVQQQGRRLMGRILFQKPEGLSIVTEIHEHSFIAEMPVVVSFKNNNGIYSFASHIRSATGSILTLEHAEELLHLQRRKFFRRHLYQPVYVKKDEDGSSLVGAALIDLSGGGARVSNTDGSFHMGDSILLRLTLPPKERIQIRGDVVHISQEGDTIHIQFSRVSDLLREKIIHYLQVLRN
jgi:c-di-GMP-binding flagellar brake protein YcgR